MKQRDLRAGGSGSEAPGQQHKQPDSAREVGRHRRLSLHYASYSAPVAQLDRVPPSEGGGHRFKSCRARHLPNSDSSFRRMPGSADGPSLRHTPTEPDSYHLPARGLPADAPVRGACTWNDIHLNSKMSASGTAGLANNLMRGVSSDSYGQTG